MRNCDISHLGAELISCRRLSGYESIAVTQGKVAAWINFYLIMPLVGVPFLALFGTVLVSMACDLAMKTLTGRKAGPVVLALAPFFVFLVAGYWFCFIWP